MTAVCDWASVGTGPSFPRSDLAGAQAAASPRGKLRRTSGPIGQHTRGHPREERATPPQGRRQRHYPREKIEKEGVEHT